MFFWLFLFFLFNGFGLQGLLGQPTRIMSRQQPADDSNQPTGNVQQPSTTHFHAYNTKVAPTPLGPYSSVVRVDNTLYLSGIVAIDPKTNNLIIGGIEAETRIAMTYMKKILEEAGSSLEQVVSVKLYVTHIADVAKINEVYKEFVSPPYPARVMVEVRSLGLGAHIEVEVMAVISSTYRLKKKFPKQII